MYKSAVSTKSKEIRDCQRILDKATDRGFSYMNFCQKYGGIIPLYHYQRELFFDHDFAKAYFGKELIWCENDMYKRPAWQYYLQQLALQKDYVKYLKKYLKDRRM